MIKTRCMKHFSENQFLFDVSGICWGKFFKQVDSIEILVNNWSSLFSFVTEKHAPSKTIRVSERYSPSIGKDLESLMSTRDRLKTAALKSKSRILMDAYRQARNRVNSLNIQLKRQYVSAKISECKGNMKKSSKNINELLNKRSQSCNIDCLKHLKHTFENKKAISNTMNNFLCTIGEKLASKIDAAPNPLLSGEATEKIAV